MYEAHWELTRNPFSDDILPALFHRNEMHQAALLKLRYACEHQQGAALLIGGTGYGKTFLAGMLEHDLAENFAPVVHVVYPRMAPGELLAYIATRLSEDGEPIDSTQPLDRTIGQLEQRLADQTANGRHPVIIIDDAHLIDDVGVFRALQLLLNFRRRPVVEFTLVIVGERSLLGRLERIPQLDDRLAVKSVLTPLTPAQTAAYVTHRLQAAGASRAIFRPDALSALAELSRGIPRRINRLCELALLVGYAEHSTELTAADIEAVAEELVTALPD
jgi:general secretion pathway protein A